MSRIGRPIAACAMAQVLSACHPTTPVTAPPPTAARATEQPTPQSKPSTALDGRRIFLGDVAIEKHFERRLDAKDPFKIVIHAALSSSTLRELSRRGVRYQARGNEGELFFHGYPRAHDRPTDRDRASSFVVDYDSSEVEAVREKAKGEVGPHAKMDELAAFVDRFIVTKDLMRSYDPASVVAVRREGDCSEHAVLLAALGRSFGFATRVVHGIVIVDGDHIQAEGHAWVEWADESGWRPADAAIPASAGPVYIPLQLLKDEGPAYGKGLLLSMPQELGPLAIEPP